MARGRITQVSETGLRILVVDDDPINQKVTPAVLKSLGYDVDLVVDGQEALNALERQCFDVVLMDLHMPVMDGITATLEIRRRVPPEDRPTIIALTATDLPGDVQRCLDAGMDYYLPKPADRKRLAELLDSIRNSIAQKSERQRNKIKVLVIDDDPIITAVYARGLQRAGFAVEVAHDGIEGFVTLQVFQPDVVLLDLNMPYQSGMNWLSKIRGTRKFERLPVVVVTDLPTDAPDVKEARESDVTGVLFKSESSPDAVIAAVSWAVNQGGQVGDTASRSSGRRR